MSWAAKKTLRSGKTKWRGCYRDINGRERSAGYYPTKREAKAAAAAEEAKILRGVWVDPDSGKVTLSAYYEQRWLPGRSVSMNTAEGYRAAYRRAIKPYWGDRQLSSIRRGDIQSWIDQMLAQGVGVPTVLKRYRLLRSILAGRRGASALADGVIAVNPCQHIRLPVERQKTVDVYSPDEFQRLVANLPQWAQEIAVFQSETGLRWGELMGIQLDKFAVGRRKLVVQRTVVQTSKATTGNGSRFAWKEEPKGGHGRAIAVSPTAREVVDALVRRHGLGASDRLFSRLDDSGQVRRTHAWPSGVPLSRETWRAVWRQAADAAGLRRLRPHTLRGSNLSWLLASGDVDVDTVRVHAGHRSLLTTQRYLGAMPDADERLLAALSATKSRYSAV